MLARLGQIDKPNTNDSAICGYYASHQNIYWRGRDSWHLFGGQSARSRWGLTPETSLRKRVHGQMMGRRGPARKLDSDE